MLLSNVPTMQLAHGYVSVCLYILECLMIFLYLQNIISVFTVAEAADQWEVQQGKVIR